MKNISKKIVEVPSIYKISNEVREIYKKFGTILVQTPKPVKTK